MIAQAAADSRGPACGDGPFARKHPGWSLEVLGLEKKKMNKKMMMMTESISKSLFIFTSYIPLLHTGPK